MDCGSARLAHLSISRRRRVLSRCCCCCQVALLLGSLSSTLLDSTNRLRQSKMYYHSRTISSSFLHDEMLSRYCLPTSSSSLSSPLSSDIPRTSDVSFITKLSVIVRVYVCVSVQICVLTIQGKILYVYLHNTLYRRIFNVKITLLPFFYSGFVSCVQNEIKDLR